MSHPLDPDQLAEPEAGNDPAPDDGERLVRKTTHEVEPGDMATPLAP